MTTEIKAFCQNYINGEFVDGGAGRLDVDNPGTGEKLAEQALADARDVDTAVAAARACHESNVLFDMRPVERGRIVRKIGDYLLDHVHEIAPVLTLESGKPLWEARKEIEGAARYFEYYGNQAETLEGRSIPLGAGYFDFTTYEPYGVSGQIIPWNFPLEMTARGIAAALATANTCVVKTPEIDPLSLYYFCKAAEYAGLPPGALNILCGEGTVAGAALSSHSDVNQIVFTGSVPTGVAIASAAAKNVVPCVLELGGKSAAIVHDDADIDNFIKNVRMGIFFNAGQVCSAMSRAIVHQSVNDEVVERLVDVAQNLSVGPGIERTEFGPNMGAMVSEKQCDRAEKMCAAAEREGAIAATGGRKMNQPGYFLEPTIMTSVTQDMEIANEEVFGPVISVINFIDDDEAIRLSNATSYGLVGGVFTRDLDRATKVAREMRAGQIFVNEWYAGGVETPFGGYGKSGYGREKGREALMNYVQTKNVAIKLSDR
ncbi:MAG: aldehyde dehydrogenase family protein [Marinicaulis sp.]|nr:aldehyde dehydrogenase family protein [Marinicaulis sp.]